MAATIYDVAALAGVSPATVSRVLNGTAVSPERARKVRDAAQALGFRPNRMARTLRKGGSEVIALVIPDVENSFFTALARGVEDRAMAAGYSVVLCNTDELAEKRRSTGHRETFQDHQPGDPTSRYLWIEENDPRGENIGSWIFNQGNI